MKFQKMVGAVILLAALGTASVDATSITVSNYSFEADVISGGDFVAYPSVTNWTIGSLNLPGHPGASEWGLFYPLTGYGFNTANPLGAPAQGNQTFAFFDILGGTASQTVGTIEGGTTYTLTVAAGWRAGTTLMPYGLDLLANGTPMTPISSVLTAPTSGNFVDNSKTYFVPTGSALAGEALAIQLTGTGNDATATQVYFDNIRLDAVPEPSAALMLLTGLGILARMGCLRRQNS